MLTLRFQDQWGYKDLIGKIVAAYCVLAGYWQVPVQDSQCATFYHRMIFATAWNVTADLMLLAIPIPIVIRVQLPLKRKIVLVCVLGLGVFNVGLTLPDSTGRSALADRIAQILTAILNCVYNFAHLKITGYLNWYAGEVATSIYVANVPACWPLLRKLFGLNTWSHQAFGTSGNNDLTQLRRLHPVYGNSSRRDPTSNNDTTLGPSESEERLAKSAVEDDTLKLTPQGYNTVQSSSVNAQDSGFMAGLKNDCIMKTVEVTKTVEISQSLDSPDGLSDHAYPAYTKRLLPNSGSL
ncbi:hypothetical protein H2203_000803 [Taxawa tesnikishii (nom. ined.)]|nr:hypothetical protein H2203_000803 [Dothideales sp. JES 119]